MNINDAFPSDYLKASDFENDTVVTIKSVSIESIGQGKKAEDKPIVHFEEFDKGLVLNKTNKGVVETFYGPETDDWIGKQITLFPTEVEFAGEQVMAIRVRLKKPGPSSPARTPPSQNGDAKSIAWKQFCAKTGALDKDGRIKAFTEAIAQLLGPIDPRTITAEQWQKLGTEIKASWDIVNGFPQNKRFREMPSSPFSEEPEPDLADAPF